MTPYPDRAARRPGEDRPGARAPSRLRSARSVVSGVVRSARRHGVTGLAAECAFFIALALFPTVLTLVALVHALRPALGRDAAPDVSAGLARLLRVVLSAHGTAAADAADGLLTGPSGGLLGAGTVLALLVLTRGVRSLLRGLAVIAERPPPGARSGWRTAFLLSIGLLSGASLLLAALVLGPLFGYRRQLAGAIDADTIIWQTWYVVRWPVAVVAMFGCAALLLRVGGRTEPPRWWSVLPGAALACAGWLAATGLLPAYVTLAGRVSPTLGALGGGLIVLVWVYLLVLSLFLGAELDSRSRVSPAPRKPAD